MRLLGIHIPIISLTRRPALKINIFLILSMGLLFSVKLFAAEILLTPEEQQYLSKKNELSLCVDPDWLPYEKLDAQGSYTGLVAQYMQLLQLKLVVVIKPKMTSNWSETQKQYEAGQCDLISALNKTSKRGQYMDFTQAYIKSPAVLVLPENNKQDTQLSDMSGKKLAMVKGYVYESKLHEQYPDIKIIQSANMNEALNMVSQGKADATIGPMYLIFSATMKLNISNLKMLGNTEYQDELHIGVRKGDTILLSIMNKALSSLTPEDHSQMRKASLHSR